MIIGVDYAVIWGLLAFLLDFVPYVGPLLAAIPGVLLALVQLGVGHALLAILAYACINACIPFWNPGSWPKGSAGCRRWSYSYP